MNFENSFLDVTIDYFISTKSFDETIFAQQLNMTGLYGITYLIFVNWFNLHYDLVFGDFFYNHF